MRWIIAVAALALGTPLAADPGLKIASGVFRETVNDKGIRVEPAATFARGDTVVTVMSWQASGHGARTIVSAVPAGLALESVSRDGLEISVDGGRSWRALRDGRLLPPSVTHLRWQAAGEGQLSYRALVR